MIAGCRHATLVSFIQRRFELPRTFVADVESGMMRRGHRPTDGVADKYFERLDPLSAVEAPLEQKLNVTNKRQLLFEQLGITIQNPANGSLSLPFQGTSKCFE